MPFRPAVAVGGDRCLDVPALVAEAGVVLLRLHPLVSSGTIAHQHRHGPAATAQPSRIQPMVLTRRGSRIGTRRRGVHVPAGSG